MLPVLLAHVPVIYVTQPSADWCGVIDQALGGDIVMFEPGSYEGTCDVVAKVPDKEGERTVLQSFDPGDQARFAPGPGGPVFRVSGDDLVILQVVLDSPGADQPLIEVGDIRRLTVRRSHVTHRAGTALSLTGAVGTLEIENTHFDAVGTPIRCAGCSLAEVDLDNSIFVGGQLDAGAALAGRLRDLYVEGGVALGGSVELDGSVIRGDPAVRIAGNATAVNSLVFGAPRAILAEGTAPSILGSTVLGSVEAATGTLRLRTSALDRAPAAGTVELEGTVVCEPASACWADAGEVPTPRSGGPLDGAGVGDPGLGIDWCRTERTSPPTAGALEVGGPAPSVLEPAFRDQVACEATGEPTDTGSTDAPVDSGGDGRVDDAPPGCGCHAGAPGHGGTGALTLALTLLGAALRRRCSSQPRPGPGGASRSR